MSFIDHDLCRRCGTADGPSHTTAECERVRAQRAEAQRAHDSQKTAPDSSLPVVTRRADGKRFRIVCQARSPDGPVDLVACDGPPFERATVGGLVFVHAYDAARTAPADADKCGRGRFCPWMRTALAAENTTGVAFIAREMEHPDTLAVVTRVVASVQGARSIVVRACPACGGNPNEETVCR